MTIPTVKIIERALYRCHIELACSVRAGKILVFFFFCNCILRHFRRSSRKILKSDNKKKVSLPPKYFLFKIFQEHKSLKSVREQSVLAVLIAKFGPLREPIRMLLFTIDQFSHIIDIFPAKIHLIAITLSRKNKKIGKAK